MAHIILTYFATYFVKLLLDTALSVTSSSRHPTSRLLDITENCSETSMWSTSFVTGCVVGAYISEGRYSLQQHFAALDILS